MLWTINLASNRALFMDEANVARNLYDRTYDGLFTTLDHEQYAPPLYLVFTKLLADIFGYREWVMRLPAFLGGLLAVYGLTRASNKLVGGYWVLLPLALLFSSETVLRYVTEVKPYGLDLGIAAFLLALHLRPRQNMGLVGWAVLGMLLPWLSLPSVFVLATIGLLNFYHDRRWLAVILAWLVSFGFLYWLVLKASVGTDYLNDFHRVYFLTFPTDWAGMRLLGVLLLGLLKLAYGFTTVAIVSGAVLLLSGIVTSNRRWLILPLAIVMAVSVLRYYSLIDRLVLFALPGMWLLVTVAAKHLFDKSFRLRVTTALLIFCLLTGTEIGSYYFSPLKTSDGKLLAQIARSSPTFYADQSAVPVLDYYRRIHPTTRQSDSVTTATDAAEVTGSNYVLIYDVTTSQATVQRMEEENARAAERGCKVGREMLYRAVVLRVKCP